MPRIIAQLNGFDRFAWVTTAYLLTSTASGPFLRAFQIFTGESGFCYLRQFFSFCLLFFAVFQA